MVCRVDFIHYQLVVRLDGVLNGIYQTISY